MEQIPIIAVVGPTASGKTGLAVELARWLDTEVVSADSMQIYKAMSIATAKPSLEEQQGIRHHLIDFVAPDQSFSVAQYVSEATKAITDIHERGKCPILVGGTGLYINSLIDHIDFTEIASDEALRNELKTLGKEKGNEALLDELRQVDPKLADRLHSNNVGRIIRGIEVFRLTGMTMTEHQIRSRAKPSPYRPCMIGIDFRDRQTLYGRINRRVDRMLQMGLVEEAAAVRRQYSATAQQAIGYKELEPYFRGEVSLQEAVDSLKQATRNYAKRQLTWFRRDSRIKWFMADELKNGEELFFKTQIHILQIQNSMV